MHYLIVVVYALQGKQLCKCFYLSAFRAREIPAGGLFFEKLNFCRRFNVGRGYSAIYSVSTIALFAVLSLTAVPLPRDILNLWSFSAGGRTLIPLLPARLSVLRCSRSRLLCNILGFNNRVIRGLIFINFKQNYRNKQNRLCVAGETAL